MGKFNLTKMPIYAIYDQNKEFIAAFPSYEEAVSYGDEKLGCGWYYNILEKALLDYPIIKALENHEIDKQVVLIAGYQPVPSGKQPSSGKQPNPPPINP